MSTAQPYLGRVREQGDPKPSGNDFHRPMAFRNPPIRSAVSNELETLEICQTVSGETATDEKRATVSHELTDTLIGPTMAAQYHVFENRPARPYNSETASRKSATGPASFASSDLGRNYDQRGRIVFTNSKSLPGVGLPRAEWNEVRALQSGTVKRTVIDTTLPTGPVEREIIWHAPFTTFNRETDYATVWRKLEHQRTGADHVS